MVDQIEEIKAKRRFTEIDVGEISGVDKAANNQKFLVFKRLEEAEGQDRNIPGGDEMAEEKNIDEVTAEKKAELEKIEKKIEASKNYKKDFEAPPEPTKEDAESLKSIDEKLSIIIKNDAAEKAGQPAGEPAKIEEVKTSPPATVTKSDEITALEQDIASETRVMELKKQLEVLKAQNKELQDIMPVRKGLEPKAKELLTEDKGDNIAKRLGDMENPENKKKYNENYELLQDNIRAGLVYSQ